MNTLLKNIFTLTILSLLAGSLYQGQSIRAAGQSLALSPESVSVSTASNVTITTTLSAPAVVGSSVQVVRPTGYVGSGVISVSAGAVGASTENTVSGEVQTTAFVSTDIPAGALTVTISGLTTPSAATNAVWKLYVGSDYGAAFQYVGQANVVQVRARVPLLLSFAIRNSADTANTNTCDMGDLSVTTIGFCEYRLKVATNARNGYTVNLSTSGSFASGTALFNNAAVGTGGSGGTNMIAGTETYGARITKGSITGVGGTTTLASSYNAGVTNFVSFVPTVSTALLTANKPNAPGTTDTTNTALVRHQATISGSTAAGLYTQTLTYTVAPSF